MCVTNKLNNKTNNISTIKATQLYLRKRRIEKHENNIKSNQKEHRDRTKKKKVK